MRRGLVTWRVLQGPGFRRLAHDTYVRSTAPDSPTRLILGLLTWAGPEAVVTGWSACRWWGCEVLPRPEPMVEIAVVERRQSPPAGCRVRRCLLRDQDVVVHLGVRVTTPLRTAYDLARLVPVVDAVVAADALGGRGRFTGVDLAAFAAGLGTTRDCRKVPEVVRLMDPRSESPMESRVRVDLVRGGLPVPVSQYEVWDGRRFVARPDLSWPEWKVAVEYDGWDHTAEDRRGRDVERVDELRRLGWIVITVTARQYRTPGWIERRVREALTERGAI